LSGTDLHACRSVERVSQRFSLKLSTVSLSLYP
jgi:hypothetical protein